MIVSLKLAVFKVSRSYRDTIETKMNANLEVTLSNSYSEKMQIADQKNSDSSRGAWQLKNPQSMALLDFAVWDYRPEEIVKGIPSSTCHTAMRTILNILLSCRWALWLVVIILQWHRGEEGGPSCKDSLYSVWCHKQCKIDMKDMLWK